jgi:hypothetical protein
MAMSEALLRAFAASSDSHGSSNDGQLEDTDNDFSDTDGTDEPGLPGEFAGLPACRDYQAVDLVLQGRMYGSCVHVVPASLMSRSSHGWGGDAKLPVTTPRTLRAAAHLMRSELIPCVSSMVRLPFRPSTYPPCC